MFEKYIEYGLHDTAADDIAIGERGITFIFGEGVYILDGEGKETVLSGPRKMSVTVENFDKNKLYEHCTFYKCRRGRYSEVDFTEIKKLLRKNRFDIDLDFYSPFARAISLKGHIGKYMLEIQISEIQAITFQEI